MFPIRSYTMPDGTKGYRRPSDGEIFNLTKNGVVESTWQWDDLHEKWYNISSGKPNDTNTATFPPIWDKDFNTSLKKCECGSEAVGSPKHSSWCQLYDNRQ